MNSSKIFTEPRSGEVDIFLKPLFTEIEKNNCFSIYTRSDLNKIREETIKKYDLIDRLGQLDALQFKNRSL